MPPKQSPHQKRCGHCGQLRDLSDFHVNSHASDGLHSFCKSCRKAEGADYLQRTAKARNHKRKKKRQKKKEWVRELKASRGCLRCGLTEAACLDFHHRDPQKKLMGIFRMTQYGYSRESILAEIEKCDVVCANCHRLIHDENELSSQP